MTLIRDDGPVALGLKHRQDECDVAVLVYDDASSASLEWCVDQQAKLSPHIPIMFVALSKTNREDIAADDGAGAAMSVTTTRARDQTGAALLSESAFDRGGADDMGLKPIAGTDNDAAAGLRAVRNSINAAAVAHTEEFQLDVPVKLSDSKSKKNRVAVS